MVNVNWHEAKAFCAWLSEKDGRTYRLPTDREWSVAVGIGDQEKRGDHPLMIKAYPWDGPPSDGVAVANIYSSDVLKENILIDDERTPTYTDGFGLTAPASSFKSNHLGIHDLGGNVCEWIQDQDSTPAFRLLRGGSWIDDPIMSVKRTSEAANSRYSNIGFRVVVEKVGDGR